MFLQTLYFTLNGQELKKAPGFPTVVEKSSKFLKVFINGIPDGYICTAYFSLSWENEEIYGIPMSGSECVIDEYITTLPSYPSNYYDYKVYMSIAGVNQEGVRFTTNMVDFVLDKTAYSPTTENTPEIPESQYDLFLEQVANALYNSGSQYANAIKGIVSGDGEVRMDDVSPVEHELDVKVTSKNLIPYPYAETTKTENGITFTNNGDGTVTINGTATARATFYFHEWSKTAVNIKEGETYTISGAVPNVCWIQCSNDISWPTDEGTGKTFVAGAGGYYFGIIVQAGTTVNNVVIKPQVEYGTTATPYTPYIADFSSVTLTRCGRNLIPYPYVETTKTVNGISFTDNGDGTVTANGTATANAFLAYASISQHFTLTPGRYTVSGGFSSNAYIQVKNADTDTDLAYADDAPVVFTLTETTKIRGNIYVKSGTTLDNVIFKPQIEIGTTATPYVPYTGTEHIANADGTVNGVLSVSPVTTLMADTDGVIIKAAYNKDTNAVINGMVERIAALESAIVNS